jgi:hypothetical protein
VLPQEVGDIINDVLGCEIDDYSRKMILDARKKANP